MRVDGNQGGTINYEPNSQGEWQSAPRTEPGLALDGQAADHWDHRVDEDYYSQPGALFRLFNQQERERLFNNIADAMDGVPQDIIERQLAHFELADPAYGAGVRAELQRRGMLT